jgi:RNase P subunit RPR2
MTFMTTARPRACRHLGGRVNPDEWRCSGCDRLLGVIRSGNLHVRFTRGHEYIAALPTTCTCRGCGTLSRLDRT